MPLSEVEIRADKDRVRAEFAIKVHKLESEIEQTRLAEARQKIEINRRDSTINELERSLGKLSATHDEAMNARRVLEQTVSDRLPRVESRLNEAKKLLFTRDREIGELTSASKKSATALTEATSLNAQLTSELERVTRELAIRSRNQGGETDARADAEAALRSEIETLKGKIRDQAQLLAKLQSMTGRPSLNGAESEISDANGGPKGLTQEDMELQLRTLKSRVEDQTAEIARLKASLAVFEAEIDSESDSAGQDTTIAIKARMQSLEAQSTQQMDTIQKLRSELAAANERIARQAAHFTNELKRLGSGGAAAGRRSGEAQQRLSITERVAQTRANGQNGAAPMEALPAAATDLAAPGHQTAPSNADGVAEAVSDAASRRPEGENRPRLLDRISNLARQS